MEWRCFHCDDVFTDRQAAQDHFGLDCSELPGCVAILTEGEKAVLESRREWRNRALTAEDQNEQLAYENHGLRFDLSRGPFKGAHCQADAERIHVELRNLYAAEHEALISGGQWLASFLRWLGETRACRRAGLKTPKLGLYLP